MFHRLLAVGYFHSLCLPFLLPSPLPPTHADKLDAVGNMRRKKRLFSELEVEAEELSLTEYLAKKMKEEKEPLKKRVSDASTYIIKCVVEVWFRRVD